MRIRRLGSSAILTRGSFGLLRREFRRFSQVSLDMGYGILGLPILFGNGNECPPCLCSPFGRVEFRSSRLKKRETRNIKKRFVKATESLGRGFLYRRQVLGAYCFVKSLDAQNFGRDSFFNKTRNFIIGLDVWILWNYYSYFKLFDCFSLFLDRLFLRKPVALQVSLDLFGRIGFHIDV
ncbi:unnamed protein product [Rhizophagus irregularis]|nr:unnamed protein product [Rhizophagus irregularis]